MPSAPLAVNGVAGDGQVVLSWTPPAQDGGDPVTAYSVTPYIGFIAQPVTTFTSPLTTETITGLTDGTAYTFAVTATTNAGTGPASSLSAPVTPATVPSAPWRSTAWPVTPGRLVVDPAGPDGGDPVTAYSVTPYIGVIAQPVTTFTSPLTTETITGLTDGTAYTFAVTATTDAGTGPASSLSAPVTPATVPSAPLAVNGVAGDGQVVLSWTPPPQDGGDPVTAYSVTPYIGFIAQPVTAFTSPLTTETITGLTDGTAYTFAVTATTDRGARTGLEPLGPRHPGAAATKPADRPLRKPLLPAGFRRPGGDDQLDCEHITFSDVVCRSSWDHVRWAQYDDVRFIGDDHLYRHDGDRPLHDVLVRGGSCRSRRDSRQQRGLEHHTGTLSLISLVADVCDTTFFTMERLVSIGHRVHRDR